MTPNTRTWLKVAGVATGFAAVGLTAALVARHRYGQVTLGSGPLPTPPKPPLQVVNGFVIEIPPGPGEAAPEGGEIVRQMSGGTDGSSIDEREIFLGPILTEVPPGRLLLLDLTLRTKVQPPAIPGAPPSPCYAFSEYSELDSDLNRIKRVVTYPSECERLQKTPSRDWDVSFPTVRVVKRPDGIYVRYNWIRFGHPQNGLVYYARDYTVTLTWSVV